jgi:hypothetical protein
VVVVVTVEDTAVVIAVVTVAADRGGDTVAVTAVIVVDTVATSTKNERTQRPDEDPSIELEGSFSFVVPIADREILLMDPALRAHNRVTESNGLPAPRRTGYLCTLTILHASTAFRIQVLVLVWMILGHRVIRATAQPPAGSRPGRFRGPMP